MANEIKVALVVSHTKTPKQGHTPPNQIQEDQTGTGAFNNTVSIGTSEEDVSFGDVSPGLVLLYNLDTTNFVEWGAKDGGGNMQAIGRLLPADSSNNPSIPGMFYLNSGKTLRMKADTGACNVQIVAYEA